MVKMDDIRLCHLGDFGQDKLSDSQLEQVGTVDVLMIPVGGTYTLDSHQAAKVVKQFEPKIVIPMHYKVPGLNLDLSDVEDFLREMSDKFVRLKQKKEVKKRMTDCNKNIIEEIKKDAFFRITEIHTFLHLKHLNKIGAIEQNIYKLVLPLQ